jgi:hypothetical protein
MMKLDRPGVRSISIKRGTRLLNVRLLRCTARRERASAKLRHAGRRDSPTQKKVMSLLVDSARLSHRAFAMHVSQLRVAVGAAGERVTRRYLKPMTRRRGTLRLGIQNTDVDSLPWKTNPHEDRRDRRV